MDAHAGKWKRKVPSTWTRIAMQCNKEDATLLQGGPRDAAVLPYT